MHADRAAAGADQPAIQAHLVADAHRARLKVTPWTFRSENSFLPVDYRIGTDPATHGRAKDEVTRFFEVGIDGDWRDHLVFALNAEEVPEGLLRRWEALRR